MVEGQGALAHPAYAAVTLGLVHGTQADALVLCHDPTRETLDDFPQYRVPPLGETIERYLDAARLTNPDARFVGVSLNTGHCDAREREALLDEVATEMGLPCTDPVALGMDSIAGDLVVWTE